MSWIPFVASAIASLAAVTPSFAFEDIPAEELVVEAEVPRRINSTSGMAFGFEALWVASNRGLLRIDANTNAVDEFVIEGASSTVRGLAVGEGHVWVPDVDRDTIFKVVPDSGAVVAEIPAQMLSAQGTIGVGAGAVWVVTAQNFEKILTRFNHQSGEIEAEISLPSSGAGVTVAHGTVWVTGPIKGELYRVDPATNTVVSSTKLGRSPRYVTADDDSVWVFNQGDGTVQRIDGFSGQLIATIDTGFVGGNGEIYAGGGYVWLSVPLLAFVQIDPASNTVLRRYMDRDSFGYIRYGAGSVWVGSTSIKRIAVPD